VVICGEDEVKKGTVVLKDMRTGEQEELKQEQLVERMQ
jgi:histidyl-tRNA synthetase